MKGTTNSFIEHLSILGMARGSFHMFYQLIDGFPLRIGIINNSNNYRPIDNLINLINSFVMTIINIFGKPTEKQH